MLMTRHFAWLAFPSASLRERVTMVMKGVAMPRVCAEAFIKKGT